VHPLAAGSPVLRALDLGRDGLSWIHPEFSLAHPFPDGSAAILASSMAETASALGGADEATYLRMMKAFDGRWDTLSADVMRPALSRWPTDPPRYGRFGLLSALPSAPWPGSFPASGPGG
jgi:phytoene dehydrogenase-like protein